MKHNVLFDPAADADLIELYEYIAARAGLAVARRYINQIVDYCALFETFPQRGMAHDELGKGIRIVGFRRKASIVFQVDQETVTIMRILHRGKSLGGAEDMEEDDF
ncbi:type II toxin-antitoxin system RelE/ParE family toxin [Neorhizobium sp. SOG26]|uniref:type II toxin-antitoxin system RelE/ParE family toxin n=1 Tax=Neorhizobium sp. SOG26 TaxID=2060726 RepID=UPI000E56856E|nr:type II toxin-antitoxin system RelE/ParE family toxin [Neorhizobium sp. SOG26]AXV14713.1 type II toxin-antitoxin system RelE/ParE family toxin [Neorhizobium sp. SOG26]